MTLPISANATFDTYRFGNSPPLPPDVAGTHCFLKPDWLAGQTAGDRTNSMTWTHIMLVDSACDVRDAYYGSGGFGAKDTLYFPDKTGTLFIVVFTELLNRGTANEHKRVHLDRGLPAWPSSAI